MGNLKSVTDAGGTVAYEYNDVNLVRQLTEPGGAMTMFEYYDDNTRKSTAYPNGVVQTATYDESNRIKTIVGTRGLTTLTTFGYDYKLAGVDTGLRQSVTHINGNITTYGYDDLDRLKTAQTKNPLGIVVDSYSYAYDPVGNRTSDTANGVTTSASHNAADQLTSRGSVSYSYDANGNQTGSSSGQALGYNSLDQTTSLKKAGGSPLSAAYAGAGQVERITAGDTAFTNTQLGVSATTEAGATMGTTRDPAGGLIGLRNGASRSYYLLDGLGSVAAMTDASGAVTHSYTYDPYGVTTETTSSALANPWRYTGQYFDVSTGLYKMGARYYQPELGRWTQLDPSGLDANPYVYAASDPINNSDPTGLFCVTGKNPNGSCRSVTRAVERAFTPGGCAVFAYPDGSCFGGNFAEVGGAAIVPVSSAVATCGAALGASPAVSQAYAKAVGKSPPAALASAAACALGVGYSEVAKRVLSDP